MDRGVDSGSVVCGAALAEPGAGAIDAGGRDYNGLAIRQGTEYFAAGGGTGNSGGAGVVGVSARLASLDEGGAGILELSLEESSVVSFAFCVLSNAASGRSPRVECFATEEYKCGKEGPWGRWPVPTRLKDGRYKTTEHRIRAARSGGG